MAWSKTRAAPVRAAPAANRAAVGTDPVSRTNRSAASGASTTKPRASTAEAAADTTSAASTSRPREPVRRGSSPISTVPRPSIPTVPASVMADTAAEP